jgi:anti-sigma regulatory factor (Ser/Thr protein kinase)
MIHCNISHKNYHEAISFLVGYIKDIDHLEFHIEFWTDHEQSKILRDFVGIIFNKHDIHSPWRWRFILITDELINNAIEHGSSQWDIDSCIIHAGRRGNDEFFIELEVHDTGNGKDAKDAAHMEKIKEERLNAERNPAYMGKRWRWLFHITEKLVDRLSFSQSPKWWLAVKIQKKIPQEEILASFAKSVS